MTGLIPTALLTVSVGLLAYGIRRTTGVLEPSDALRPLRKNTQQALDQICTRNGPYGGDVSLSFADLLAFSINARNLVRTADELRRQGQQSEELDQSHALISKRARRLAGYIIAAVAEKILLQGFYYSTAAAWYYSQQLLAVDDLSDIAGLPLPVGMEAI